MEIVELKKLIIERNRLKAELMQKLEPFKGMQGGGMPNPMQLMEVVPMIPEVLKLIQRIDEISDQVIAFVVEQINQTEELPES